MSRAHSRSCALIFAIAAFATTAFGQTQPTAGGPQVQPTPTPSLEKKFFINLLRDQKAIWTSPFSLHRSDAKWIAPLGISAAVLWGTDRRTAGELIEPGNHQTRLNISKAISRGGSFYVTGGVAAGFYFVGRARHDSRARETGLLSAEALIDGAIVVSALKAISQRPRPTIDHASGEFFDRGSSFPSGHAVGAWSVATVIAYEYGPHHPLIRYGAYGIATVVSLSRYTGSNHFLSDVLVGSALGFGIGRYVYHQHHDRSLDQEAGKTKTSFMRSKFFPLIAPNYSARGHVYGATLDWSF
jgi:membrane-associated phospholipid phosphatase